MSSIARGDGAPGRSSLTAYYAASGTPPGWYVGAGLAGLDNGRGIPDGSLVSEEGLFRMLGMLTDPMTGQPLGRVPPAGPASLAQRIRDRFTALPAGLSGVERAVEVAGIEAEEHARERRVRRPVAGFDLTFSVPKSISIAWALADPATRAIIHAAHRDAIRIALDWAERTVVFTRTGAGGRVQEPVRGVVAAAFDHWDSRAGDPHLHTHVTVLNRVQGVDGQWRALDSRTLFGYTVALSELHEGVLTDLLTQRLGLGWVEHPRTHSPTPRLDIDGVPAGLITEFSRRSVQIEETKNTLTTVFADSHGRQPDAVEVLRLRQHATLATRPDKQHRSLDELSAGWRDRAQPLLDAAGLAGVDPARWVATLRDRCTLPALTAGDLDAGMVRDTAAVVLAAVSAKRATFTHANLLAETHRLLHGTRFTSPAERLATAARITEHALDEALLLTRPTPDRVIAPSARRYTTRTLFDAETRLLDAARRHDGPRLPHPDSTPISAVDPSPETVGTASAAHAGAATEPARSPVVGAAGVVLTADQAAALTSIVTSGRVVDLLVGPAGTGKTHTLRAIRTCWEARYGPGSVLGLAPSAVAAQVLGESLQIAAENTSKWLLEHDRTPDRDHHLDQLRREYRACSSTGTARAIRLAHQMRALRRERDQWNLHPGQLVILDEATLAGTLHLDQITAHSATVGAKLLLVGDPAQLSAVPAGGAFTMLTHDRHPTTTTTAEVRNGGSVAAELSTVHRFTHGWERAASLRLREGDHDVIEAYGAHGRLHNGDRGQVLDELYAAWRRDIETGLGSLMITSDTVTAAELNARAHTDHLRRHVTDGGDPVAELGLGDGTAVSVGDRILTRHNDRRLRTGRGGWVRNGDTWTVTALHPDGSLTARADAPGTHTPADTDGGRAAPGSDEMTVEVWLPADYTAAHVELGYATTAYRAQGRTVDTTHSHVEASTSREVLYVAATRGRRANHLYIDTTGVDPDPDTSHAPATENDAVDVLRTVLNHSRVDVAAHTIRAQHPDPDTPIQPPPEPAAHRPWIPLRERAIEPSITL